MHQDKLFLDDEACCYRQKGRMSEVLFSLAVGLLERQPAMVEACLLEIEKRADEHLRE